MSDTNDIKQGLASVFDIVASDYDANRFFSLSAAQLVRRAMPETAARALDVCTGTGIVAIELARQYPELRIDGIDLSAGMLDQARAKVLELGMDNIRFVQMDVDDVDRLTAGYDIVTCGYGLFFLPDMVSTLGKLLAVTRSGGRVVFSSFTEDAFEPLRAMFMADLRDCGVEVPGIGVDRLQSRDKIAVLCEQCSVASVVIETETLRYEISPEGWWELLNSAAYKGLINMLPDEQVDSFKKQHLDAIANIARDGVIELIADSYYATVTA